MFLFDLIEEPDLLTQKNQNQIHVCILYLFWKKCLNVALMNSEEEN